jgi:hypothetical protein
MNCIHAFFFRERDDSRYVQIGLNRTLACADLVGFVGLETMQRQPILLRIDGHGPQPEFVRGTKDANGDFAAVGSEQFPN